MSAAEKDRAALRGDAVEPLWRLSAGRADYSLPLLGWLALAALRHLAAARLALATITPADVLARNAAAARLSPAPAPELAARACERAAFFIPRVARRVPWRADCLVQALAGQAWLAAAGVTSEVRVGASAPEPGTLEAHAWLIAEGRVLLGGDVARYHPLIGPRCAAKKPTLP